MSKRNYTIYFLNSRGFINGYSIGPSPVIFELDQVAFKSSKPTEFSCKMLKGDNLDQQKIWEDQLNRISARPVDHFLFSIPINSRLILFK